MLTSLACLPPAPSYAGAQAPKIRCSTTPVSTSYLRLLKTTMQTPCAALVDSVGPDHSSSNSSNHQDYPIHNRVLDEQIPIITSCDWYGPDNPFDLYPHHRGRPVVPEIPRRARTSSKVGSKVTGIMPHPCSFLDARLRSIPHSN
ncbi:uncharacterized protein J3R85_007657 [Psidium guajava]|nr:uncharacterized protein J3R85_007657 [Psidium guajava]